MTLPAVPSRLLPVVAALAMALALVVVPGARAGAADPLDGAPAQGTCYNLTPEQAAATTLPAPVPCTEPHTHWVGRSLAAPDGLELKAGPKLDSFSITVCDRGRRELVGTDDRAWALSAYRTFYFLPTRAQRSAGSRWVTCLVAVVAGNGFVTTRAETPEPTDALPLPQSITSCQNARVQIVPCSKPHRARGVAGETIYEGRMTAGRADTLAVTQCPKITAGYNGVFLMRRVAAARNVLICFRSTRG
ncbi:septum formation family protein [Nocardioides sp.]|uniref:septum formation family protein n=1 Tax=Nocardioides sp. TaxID=35761 RepID=UPI003512E53D